MKAYILKIFEYYNSGAITQYRYHVMDGSKELLIRWDNAPHHNELKSFPHHFHKGTNVEISDQPTLSIVLDLIPNYW